MRIIAEEVAFSNQDVRLAGTLYKPDDQRVHPAMIVLHAANGGTRDYPFYQHLKTELPADEIAVLIFDRRGSGESTGDFDTASFDDLAADGLAAFDYLLTRRDIDRSRIGFYGISQGGWLAPIAAANRSDVAFVIIVSGSGVTPANQMNYGVAYHLRQAGYSAQIIEQVIKIRNHVDEYFRGQLRREVVEREIKRVHDEPWFETAYLGDGTLPDDVTKSKWYYEFDYDPLPIWQKVSQPTLFIFGEYDEWVPITDSLNNYRAATKHISDVTLLQTRGTDHLMRLKNHTDEREVSTEYIEAMIDWLAARLMIEAST